MDLNGKVIVITAALRTWPCNGISPSAQEAAYRSD